MRNNSFDKYNPGKYSINPNGKVNELKKRYGSDYDYSFLEVEEEQRKFYLKMLRQDRQY